IADDILLRHVLTSTTIRDIGLERLLTCIRLVLLFEAAHDTGPVDNGTLHLCCALARQCFINEYVFAMTSEEAEEAELLKERLADALAKGLPISHLSLAAIACYFPLHSISGAHLLLKRAWPAPIDEVVTQQVRDQQEEQHYLNSIPCLTAIDDNVSLQVRRQYEENPYPRW